MFVFSVGYRLEGSFKRLEVIASDEESAIRVFMDQLGIEAIPDDLTIAKEASAAAAAKLLKALREARHFITGSSHLDEEEMLQQMDEALRAGTAE